MGHDKCRYCREIDVKAAFRLEALAKRRFDESLTEFRDDAAANVDATAGTEGQRRLPAIVPSMAQNMAVASTQSGSSVRTARSVI